MLQSQIISNELCAVAYNPTEIMVRKRGKAYYGTEKQLVSVQNGKLRIFMDVAKDYGRILDKTVI